MFLHCLFMSFLWPKSLGQNRHCILASLWGLSWHLLSWDLRFFLSLISFLHHLQGWLMFSGRCTFLCSVSLDLTTKAFPQVSHTCTSSLRAWLLMWYTRVWLSPKSLRHSLHWEGVDSMCWLLMCNLSLTAEERSSPQIEHFLSSGFTASRVWLTWEAAYSLQGSTPQLFNNSTWRWWMVNAFFSFAG